MHGIWRGALDTSRGRVPGILVATLPEGTKSGGEDTVKRQSSCCAVGWEDSIPTAVVPVVARQEVLVVMGLIPGRFGSRSTHNVSATSVCQGPFWEREAQTQRKKHEGDRSRIVVQPLPATPLQQQSEMATRNANLALALQGMREKQRLNCLKGRLLNNSRLLSERRFTLDYDRR